MSNIPSYCHIYWESYKKFHNWALMVAAKDKKKSTHYIPIEISYCHLHYNRYTLICRHIHVDSLILLKFFVLYCDIPYLIFYFIKFFYLSTPDMIFGALNFKRPTFLFLTSKYVQRVGEIDILTYWYINMNM